MFHDEKINTVSIFRKKLVEAKAAEPFAVRFWKRNFNFDVRKHMWLLSLQMYPGDKTPSTTMEDTA